MNVNVNRNVNVNVNIYLNVNVNDFILILSRFVWNVLHLYLLCILNIGVVLFPVSFHFIFPDDIDLYH